jgi:hypothetical protein
MKTFASLVVVFIALASGRTPSQSLRDETPLRWGQAVEGLRIGLAGGMSVSPSAAEFNIALQNGRPRTPWSTKPRGY